MEPTATETNHILLAEDDDDDRLLFLDVLKELPSAFQLTTARNGEHLMDLLNTLPRLPNLVFLDLNMPRKNGFECLEEIKKDSRFRRLPVIIFSTTSQPSTVSRVYKCGASLYIRKPSDFAKLKQAIQHVLEIDWEDSPQPPKEEFLLV